MGDVLPVAVVGVNPDATTCMASARLVEPLMGFAPDDIFSEMEVMSALRQPLPARVLAVLPEGIALVKFEVSSMDNSRTSTIKGLVDPPLQYTDGEADEVCVLGSDDFY